VCFAPDLIPHLKPILFADILQAFSISRRLLIRLALAGLASDFIALIVSALIRTGAQFIDYLIRERRHRKDFSKLACVLECGGCDTAFGTLAIFD
jgi:hypothetical protein